MSLLARLCLTSDGAEKKKKTNKKRQISSGVSFPNSHHFHSVFPQPAARAAKDVAVGECEWREPGSEHRTPSALTAFPPLALTKAVPLRQQQRPGTCELCVLRNTHLRPPVRPV